MSDYTILSDIMSSQNEMASQTTGQMKPIEGKEELMHVNHAGGYTFTVSDVDYIMRCLILGTNKNTYYATAREMSQECIEFLNKMIVDGKGSLLVDTISKVYEDGRAPKQDPTLMALALASSCSDLETRKKAYKIVSKLRTFSHIYTWKGYHKVASKSKGMGKLSKSALCDLFQNMAPTQLSYQVTKYPHRKTAVEDWSFIDLMRCIHLKGDKLHLEGQYVLKHAIKGKDEASKFLDSHPEIKESHVVKYMCAVERVKELKDTEDDRVELIKTTYEFNLPREVLPTWAFNYADVWRALLLNREQTKVTMPMTALIRNLGVMSNKGVFGDALTTSLVTEHLKTESTIKKARLHPVNILIAMFTYQAGHGEKGKLSWTPNIKIVEALENAFYKSFKYVAPTGKRILHGIDCSGSMTGIIPCMSQISAHQAASVLAMTFSKIESESPQKFVGFTSSRGYGYGGSTGLTELKITPNMSLNEVCKVTQRSDFGTTDCSLPIEEAIKDFKTSDGKKGLYDVFMIYTDNETYAGNRHPSVALKEYRKLTGIPAKMVVIACTPTASSIADPTDGGMLDVVGFDTNAPEIVMNFIRGESLDNGLEAGPVIAEENDE
jgi:60 kDa SS-A/Ro ribonucleoprotein